MDYTKLSNRELDALLRIEDDATKRQAIEEAMKALAAKKAADKGITFKKAPTVRRPGVVAYVTPMTINTKVGVRLKGSEQIITSELTPSQLAISGGELRKGVKVEMQFVLTEKGVTQYKDDKGDVHFHESTGEFPGLVVLLTPEEIDNYNQGW